jgi:hypothetical protein
MEHGGAANAVRVGNTNVVEGNSCNGAWWGRQRGTSEKNAYDLIAAMGVAEAERAAEGDEGTHRVLILTDT